VLDGPAPTDADAARASRFEFAPPRHFVLPAVLLLLSEQPGYGYNLEKDLREFGFGKIDRPTVYRTLALLEQDGLVQSWTEAPTAGKPRRVYGVTPLGERVLRVWMSVIEEERDCLARVLGRYRATGTVDAALAEVEGGWARALDLGWSPVSPISPSPRRVEPLATLPSGTDAGVGTHRVHFRLVPERSVVLLDVRSTVGPISFGAIGVTGALEAEVAADRVSCVNQPAGFIEIALDGLRSGNGLYDAELLRRIDVRRFPIARLELSRCAPLSSANRYRLQGELAFHGVTQPADGTVNVTVKPDGRLVVTGEHVFDIRSFAVPSPTMLMLRIYPDVRVRLQIEAQPDGT
jgi:DNA-binding PadR family transcriptional regulator